MRVLHRHEHQVVGTQDGYVAESVESRSRFAMSPGQLLGGGVGLVTTVIGVIAVTRGGIDTSLNVPVHMVAGLHQSAMVGVAEIILGLLLVAGAASAWDRALLGFVGGLMFVGGIIVAAASIRMLGDLGTDHATGWTMLIGGVIAMVGAMMPTFVHDTAVRRDL